MESLLSRLLVVAPEASPVIVPSGTGSAGAKKTCNNDLNEMNQMVLNILWDNIVGFSSGMSMLCSSNAKRLRLLS